MNPRARQLAFDLAHRPALGAEDFMVGSANAAALEIVDRWPDWPHWAVVVSGPARSGKSHLANVWRYQSNAEIIAASALTEADAGRLRQHGSLVVENLEAGINDEQMLFHLLNIAREHQLSILLTSQMEPGELEVTFPDLRSRLRALPLVRIDPPDELLLQAVLLKHFADRQLNVEPVVIDHLASHMERSFEAAHGLVEEIDRRSLADKRRVTRALVTGVLQDWINR